MYTQQHGDTMSKTRSIPLTIRVPVETADRLEEMARQHRQQTGDQTGRADLVRQAIDDFMKRQKEDQA